MLFHKNLVGVAKKFFYLKLKKNSVRTVSMNCFVLQFLL